jgi:hypothetical protein
VVRRMVVASGTVAMCCWLAGIAVAMIVGITEVRAIYVLCWAILSLIPTGTWMLALVIVNTAGQVAARAWQAGQVAGLTGQER